MPRPARDSADGVPAGALGLLETVGLVAAVEAADAMLKAADVRLVRQQRTVPALVTHVVVGDTAAVRSAVDAGAAAAARVGRVAAAHVIPSPADDVWRVLVGVVPGEDAPARPAGGDDDAPDDAAGADRPDEAGPDETADNSDSGASSETASGSRSASDEGAARDRPDDTAVEGLDYAGQTVRELRALARDRDDDRLQGRDIARATKGELVAFLRETE